VSEYDLEFGQHLKSILKPDSIHLTGLINGKKVEDGYKSNTNLIDISIQLSNAK
jgi:hypothetical protein